ncbi:MOSC domain-containing protein [Nocardioides rubriscoriae]|uniref:MOSC domain-containing protein n=1 Tax=Nocardioides rubriscoriae TaxID=642762 RepID=UPI001B87AAE8|nr:MOSC domain-containing protein [Nocardioides rubriscoriae]
MSQLHSVNVGRPRRVDWTTIGRTSIDKTSVTGPVAVAPLGLDGDEVSNRRHHGGPDKAVYAFAREDLDRWADMLGLPVPDGMFGENLTTVGLDVNGAEIGERWRIGDPVGDHAVVEVTMFRTPCQTFKAWLARNGYDDRAWVKRFSQDLRPGAYLRVVVPGTICAGDPIEVVHRPGTGVTVTSTFAEVVAPPVSG